MLADTELYPKLTQNFTIQNTVHIQGADEAIYQEDIGFNRRKYQVPVWYTLKNIIAQAIPLAWGVGDFLIETTEASTLVKYTFMIDGKNYDCFYDMKHGDSMEQLIDEMNCDVAIENAKM